MFIFPTTASYSLFYSLYRNQVKLSYSIILTWFFFHMWIIGQILWPKTASVQLGDGGRQTRRINQETNGHTLPHDNKPTNVQLRPCSVVTQWIGHSGSSSVLQSQQTTGQLCNQPSIHCAAPKSNHPAVVTDPPTEFYSVNLARHRATNSLIHPENHLFLDVLTGYSKQPRVTWRASQASHKQVHWLTQQ